MAAGSLGGVEGVALVLLARVVGRVCYSAGLNGSSGTSRPSTALAQWKHMLI